MILIRIVGDRCLIHLLRSQVTKHYAPVRTSYQAGAKGAPTQPEQCKPQPSNGIPGIEVVSAASTHVKENHLCTYENGHLLQKMWFPSIKSVESPWGWLGFMGCPNHRHHSTTFDELRLPLEKVTVCFFLMIMVRVGNQ